jgi:hypothetical protein
MLQWVMSVLQTGLGYAAWPSPLPPRQEKGRDGGADRRGKNGKPGWPCSRAFPALILQHALK